MTTQKNLHKKIRHYCLDNFEHWVNLYQKVREKRPNTFSYSYEPNDYDIFPRYQANEALLQGVEEIEPTNYNSLDELKSAIIESALNSQTIFTKDIYGTAKNAIDNERKKFKKFVENINEQDLINVPDLFYRRKLINTETNNWKTKLKLHSVEFTGFWFPKNEITQNLSDFLIFDEDIVDEQMEKDINQIIKSFIINNYFVFNEDNVNYELEKNSFDLFNLSPETFMFDETLNWIIYYSHEDFYIIKNREIAERIKNNFAPLKESMNEIINNGR